MKLARVIRTGGSWIICKPSLIVDKPPVGTIVQYERDVNEVYEVYFPGIPGYAPIRCDLFWEYFEDIYRETS